MMIRRTLNNQPNMDQETQRENIFHTRFKVLEMCVLSLWIVVLAAIIVALGWLTS